MDYVKNPIMMLKRLLDCMEPSIIYISNGHIYLTREVFLKIIDNQISELQAIRMEVIYDRTK